MEANLIKVGNSKGIIIPSKFLKLIGLIDKVNIEVKNNNLIIKPIEENIRKDWDKLFSESNSKNDRELLIPDIFEDENLDEWTW